MALASDFLTSNLLRAEDLKPGEIIEATVVSAAPNDFEDGRKLIIRLDVRGGIGIVLNQTRLKTMIGAFGLAYETAWPGNKIRAFQGPEKYGSKPTVTIVIKPIVTDKLKAEQRKAIEAAPVATEYADEGNFEPEDYVGDDTEPKK
jgi:hypothetical protein